MKYTHVGLLTHQRVIRGRNNEVLCTRNYHQEHHLVADSRDHAWDLLTKKVRASSDDGDSLIGISVFDAGDQTLVDAKNLAGTDQD